jgi:FkbM family methyltransferase
MKYYSQVGQDKYLNEKVFKGKTNGFFVDIGAHDGVTFSNSLFFEETLGWNGLCIEPNPTVFTKLEKARECILENCCIADKEGEVEFLCGVGRTEMLSGIKENYDPRHLNRMQREVQVYGGSINNIKVKSMPLHVLCEKHNIDHIDFCSIDVEGSELNVLSGIDFGKVKVDYFCIENNFNEPLFRKYLEPKGYEIFGKVDSDDVFKLKSVQP